MKFVQLLILSAVLILPSCIPDSKNKKQEEVVFPEDEISTEDYSADTIISDDYETFEEEEYYPENDCYDMEENFLSEEARIKYYEADSLYTAADYRASIDILDEIYVDESENLRVLLLLGLNYLDLEEYENSDYYLTRMIDIDNNCFMAYSNRSSLYYFDSRYEDAIEDARTSISLKPDCSYPYLTLGKIFLVTENKRRGCNCMRKVVRIGNDSKREEDAISWFKDYCQ